MCETKICSDCKLEKLHAEFTVDKRSPAGITGRCKSCTKIKAQAWYKKNKERVLRNRILRYKPKGKATFPHLAEEAKAIGAELVGKDPRAGYGLYKLSCGHTSTYRYFHVKSGNISCQICVDEEVAFRAMYVGLTLNFGETSSRAGTRNYTFMCGHVRDLSISHVANNNFKCKVCQELRNKNAAEIHNALLIGASSDGDPNYRSYCLPCGCTKDIKVANASNGVWVCRSCDAGYFQRKSNIYLLKFQTANFSWLKLGFSYSVEARVRDYKLAEPFESEVIFVKEISSGQDALLLEKEIHRNLKHLKLPKELMRKFHSKSGYTECYPDGLEDTIIRETEEVIQKHGKETENQQVCQSA